MREIDATEQAYKNGYEKGRKEAEEFLTNHPQYADTDFEKFSDVIEVIGNEQVHNCAVYGLYNSMRASRFPMSSNVLDTTSAEELWYWSKNGFISDFVDYSESGKYPKFVVKEDHSEIVVKKDSGEEVSVLIDTEDIPNVFGHDWHTDEYCRSNELGLLHRHLAGIYGGIDDGLVVDHINGDKLDNRKCNLRVITHQENSFNAKVRKNNSSGCMGVSWQKEKRRWRVNINVNWRQIHIGYFVDKEDAIRARLQAEKDYFGKFSPQRALFEKYGIDPVKDDDGIAKATFFNLEDAIRTERVSRKLGTSKIGSGDDNWLNGITIQFDLTFSNKAWVELQRYHFIDFVSSQSTMHRITKFDLDKAYNKYVDPRIVKIMKKKVKDYNNTKDEEEKKEKYLEILYSNPAGFMLTARLTTNYRQCKVIYNQRKDHRLPEWRSFCKWLETLPYSELITGIEKSE